MKEDGVELSVVLEEDSQAFWDAKDGMAMGDIFDDLVVNRLPTSPRLRRISRKLHRSLRPAGAAHPTSFVRLDKLTTGEKAIRSECWQPSQYTRAAPLG
jgi:hypothetical protein